MTIEFDLRKDLENRRKHQISLARAEDFEPLVVLEDARFEYGEIRYRAFGMIDNVAHCLVFTVRDDTVRAISLRRAHAKEMKRYVP